MFIASLVLTMAWYRPAIAQATKWRTLAKGLEYTKIYPMSVPLYGVVHAFRINLRYYNLDLALASDQNKKIALVESLVNANHAIIGINGGFFNPKLKPLGLRIKNGTIRNPIKSISWWGVFYISKNRPHIVSQRAYRPSRHIHFAIQSGPRLIINGRIPSLKAGLDVRSALGITGEGRVVLVATQNLPITTTQLAKLMRKPISKGGLGCIDALNLDGGSSTQLYAKINDFMLYVPGFTPVADAVLVIPKK